MKREESNHILGIDPGTILMGYGVIASVPNRPRLVAMGVLKLDRYKSHYERLMKINEAVEALINRYNPMAMAIEAPFYGKNIQTTLKLGRAQGAAMIPAMKHGLTVTEYAPSSIKKAITGLGNASKEQVATLIKRLLSIEEELMLPELDATDGLAAALCHHIQLHSPFSQEKQGKSSWEAFIKAHPEKVRK